MNIPHPFDFVPPATRKGTFYFFLILSLICFAIFQLVLSAPIKTTLAPLGIVSFELAFSVETARAILGSWGDTATKYATFGLGFDYLFILCYSFAIGLGTLLASQRLEKRFLTFGVWIGWGVCLAGLLDALENLFLLVIMFKGNTMPFPLLAGIAASIKFLFIFAGILYGLFGLAMPRKPRQAAKKANPA